MGKGITRYFLLSFLLVGSVHLNAQEDQGMAALQSSQTGRKSRWQNWVFAGGALVAAGIGITFIVLNQGSHSH